MARTNNKNKRKARGTPESSKRRSRVVSLVVDVIVLAIDSNHEEVTKIASEYREKHVYPYLEKKGFTIVRKKGPLARRIYVAQEARKPNVDYISGLGHGGYNVFTGDYYDPIFSVGNYSQEESKGKIVHLLSCQTARDLGPDFVTNGCRAFFGYDEKFSFQKDVSDIFFECDSEIDIAFADDLTAGQVYERVKTLFDKHIDALRQNGQYYPAGILEYNRDHLRSPSSGPQWGNPNARLE